MKYLRVEMPDKSLWDVPADLIANHRASYFAGQSKSPADTYKEEYEFGMEYDSELQDWAENNLNWSQVKGYAVKVEGPHPVDYEDGWTNGEKEFVDHD